MFADYSTTHEKKVQVLLIFYRVISYLQKQLQKKKKKLSISKISCKRILHLIPKTTQVLLILSKYNYKKSHI